MLVLLPLAAVAAKAISPRFWTEVTSPAARSALELTIGASLAVTAINVVFGTIVAWVLVRDEFPGKRIVGSVVDLPFALPTVVAGLVLLGLYGPTGPVGVDIAYTRTAVGAALLFVTLPFVVRAVQPVLAALDTEAEDAAATLTSPCSPRRLPRSWRWRRSRGRRDQRRPSPSRRTSRS